MISKPSLQIALRHRSNAYIPVGHDSLEAMLAIDYGHDADFPLEHDLGDVL